MRRRSHRCAVEPRHGPRAAGPEFEPERDVRVRRLARDAVAPDDPRRRGRRRPNIREIVSDHHVVEFITDDLRIMVGGNLNAFEIENLMDNEMKLTTMKGRCQPE